MAKKKKNTTLRWIIIGAVFVAALISAAFFFKKDNGIEVVTEQSTVRTILSTVSESGEIQPRTEVKLAPDVSGEIVDLRVKEGDYVTKGDLILTIRPDNYQSALEQAQAALNSARSNHKQAQAAEGQAKARYLQDSSNFQRNDQLYKQKVISKLEWETSKLQAEVSRSQLISAERSVEAAFFQIESAQASLKQAQQNLQRTNIYATMDGVITLLNVEMGERVVGTMQMQGTELLRIADLSRMEVKVDVNENDIVNVEIGDTAWIEVDAFGERKFKGKVTEIAYSASMSGLGTTDQITNFEVKVEIDPASYRSDGNIMQKSGQEMNQISLGNNSPFRPGMSALVEIFTDKREQVIAVPIQAVTLHREGEEESSGNLEVINEVVFLFEDGIAKEVFVETGASDDKYIEIKSGIEEDQSVITGPYIALTKRLKDGSKVVKQGEEGKRGGWKGP